jgi:hypothetical protein
MKLDRLSLAVGAIGSALVMGVTSLVVGRDAPTTSAQIPTMDQQVSELRLLSQNAQTAAHRAQVIATIYQLDSTGLHALDESVTAGTIPPGSLGRIRRARIATHATTWPEPLRETAMSLMGEMEKLESAVRDEDVSRATSPAHEVHEIAHRLSDQAYSWLGGGQPSTHGTGQGQGTSHGTGQGHGTDMPGGH